MRRIGGHYVAYARNDVDGRWYEFDDTRVTPKTLAEIERVEAYLLFYRRRSASRARERKRMAPLVQPLVQQPQPAAGAPQTMIVSRAWYDRWLTCVDPGPVTCSDIVCQHGGTARHGVTRLAP